MDREHRVRRRSDYVRTQREGRRLSHPLLRIRWVANGLPVTRFGIVVGKRVAAKAHERNLVRRRLREQARQLLPDLREGFDVVVIAQPAARAAAFAELGTALRQVLERARLGRCPEGATW